MMKQAVLVVVGLLVGVGLTACGEERHATLEDCYQWTVTALEERGTDITGLEQDIADNCQQKLLELGQSGFDDVFLSDPR